MYKMCSNLALLYCSIALWFVCIIIIMSLVNNCDVLTYLLSILRHQMSCHNILY